MSRASTSWPRSCSARLARAAPAPMSSTRPEVKSKATSGSAEKYSTASAQPMKPSERSISSYEATAIPPAS
jgi:hypothetical protein